MKKVSFKEDVLPLKNVLYRLALRITQNREEAEDVVQDTMLKVWNKRSAWHLIDSIEAFSLTVCRNLALDKTRRAGRNTESLEQTNAEAAGPSAETPLERMAQKDKVEQVRRIINSLPERQRSCLQLRDFEGKSYKEAAQVLGITEEQVKVNIFRARQAVKQKYLEIDKYGL